MASEYPPIDLWPETGKAPRGPNELQRMYFIDLIPPEKRPHLHTQDVLLSIGGQGSSKTFGAVMRMIDQCSRWPMLEVYLGAFNMKVLQRNVWKPFEKTLLVGGDRKKKHPFLIKTFSEQSQIAKFANGSSITCINLQENIKENIGFTAGLLVIDELHLLPDEEALRLLIGRARGTPPEIRQVILCTNPEKTKEGWINQTFNLQVFDGVDTSEHPVQKLVGPKCKCQWCTNCRASFHKNVEWVKGVYDAASNTIVDGDDYTCPNCKARKDFYTWKGKKHWCPGDQQYWRVIKSESHHNPHLPDDYYQGMEDMYDPVFFDIMVKGKLNSNLREDYVYSDFKEENNVLPEAIPINYAKDFYWSLDFNFKPECSVVCQFDKIEDQDVFIVKDEIVMYGPTMDQPYGGAKATDVANEFVRRYRKNYLDTKVYIYGDPHGWGGQVERELTRYAQVFQILTANGFDVEVIATDKQIPLKERVDTLNSVFKKRQVFFNPNRQGDHIEEPGCDHLIKSAAELKWKDNVAKDVLSENGDANARRSTNRSRVYCMTHPTDALSYVVYFLFSLLDEFQPPAGLYIVGKTAIEQVDGKVKVTHTEAPELTKRLEEEAKKDEYGRIESPVTRENKKAKEAIEAEIERMNNASLNTIMQNYQWRW